VPIIAVAKIGPNAMTAIGKPSEVRGVPEGPIQLFRVDISIENILKGAVPAGRNAFFYFQRITATGPALMGFYSRGTFRDILLLRNEKGRLRLIRDVRSNCAPTVYTGAHPAFKPTPGESVHEQMVDILLTPGKGVTDAGMLHAIFEMAPFLTSHTYTLVKLLQLSESDSSLMRTAACLQFRDLVSDLLLINPKEALDLSARLGIPRSDLERWHLQKDQNYPASDWWLGAPQRTTLPATSVPPNGPRGLQLCVDDKALGVPPLRHR
jgi:hypothetical protein